MRGLLRQRALLAFTAGVLLIALTLSAFASERSLRRSGSDGVPIQLVVGVLPPGAVGCQPHEPIPAGTTAVQIHAPPGAPGTVAVRVRLTGAGRYSGEGAPGRLVGSSSVVAPLAHPVNSDVVAGLCIENTGRVALALQGIATGPADQLTISTAGGQALKPAVGRVRIDDLLNSRPVSLWSALGRLPERVATATGSALAPWLALIGLLAALTLTVALLLNPAEGAGARGRRDVLLSFAVAFAIGMFWVGVTPAFQKTDETAHFAYVQAFAELGHPPTQFNDTGLLSDQLACWYDGLGVLHYRFYPTERPPWSRTVRVALDRQCAKASPRYDGAMYMAFQPPAYYALAAAAYKLTAATALPTRLLSARLASALLAALAVALTYLLARELTPGSPWPARAAALALALQPVFMFNATGVNPDALVIAVASAIALLGARAYKRGLTLQRALALGALTGLGVLSKTNFLALLPSIALLAAALWWGSTRDGRAQHAKRLAAGATLAMLIFGVYALLNDLAWHRGLRYRDVSYGGTTGSVHRLLEFTWQFFLPRLHMHNLTGTAGIPFLELIENSTTRLGWWNDYGLANGWTPVLMILGVTLATSATLYVIPRARRHPAPLLTTLGCAALFLAALVWAGYQFSLGTGVDVIIPRHALPLIPLWGLLVAASTANARPRWQPALTSALAAILLAHTAIAITTTTSRFYL